MTRTIWAAMLALTLSSPAFAATIATLYSTGVDAAGNPLAAGAVDPHYTILETSSNAEVLLGLPPAYLENDENSQWIWQQSSGQPINVTRTFRTTFDLTGFDASTTVIFGEWGVDNIGVDILINGVSTGISLPSNVTSNFSELTPWVISSGFVEGINTIDFVVQDVGIISGFRANLSGEAALVPVPPALFLFCSGLFGLFAAGSSRTSKPEPL